MNMKKKNEIAAAEWDEKTLYICLQSEEHGDGPSSISWLIQAVDLSHLLLPSASCCTPINTDTNTTLVRTVACFPDFDLNYQGPCCGVFGSKILFADKPHLISSGEVYVFETDPNVDPEPMIKKSCSPSFVKGKHRALLMELDDGNLYALSGSHRGPDKPHPAFEVFDSCKGKWSALPDPPLYVEKHVRRSPRWSDICCATVGNNILLSSPSDPQTLHCFDAATQQWTQHSTVDPLLSSSAGRALVLNYDDDDGFIVFTYSDNHLWDDSSYSRKNRWDSIQVYHMTKEYEHLKHIESHQMPHHEHFEMRLGHHNHNYNYGDKYSFFHLGGRQVCLVLGCHNWYPGEGTRLTIVVVVFEYTMAKREEASWGQFNFLATRLLEFDIDRQRERFHYNEESMLGAFVMPSPETKKRKAATVAHKNSNLSPAAKPFFPSFNSNSVTYDYTTATRMDGSQFPQPPSVAHMVAPTSALGQAHQYQYHQYLHPNSHSQADFGHMTRWEPTLGFGIHGSNNGGYEFTQQPTFGHMVAPLMRTDWYTDQSQYQYPFQTGLISLNYAPRQPVPGYPNSQSEAYMGHYNHNWLYPTFYQRYN